MPAMAERRVWIPMADGVRLAATLYLPEQGPSPVVLEALPYRKDDVRVDLEVHEDGQPPWTRRWRRRVPRRLG